MQLREHGMMGKSKISTEVISLFVVFKESYSKLIRRANFTEAFPSSVIPSATAGHPTACFRSLMKFILILVCFPLPPRLSLPFSVPICRTFCSGCRSRWWRYQLRVQRVRLQAPLFSAILSIRQCFTRRPIL